jgi:acetolactate synthase-1/2/3 large subunit
LILQALRRALPRNAVFFNDMTMVCYRAVDSLPVYAPRSFFFPAGFGALGFALPAAIGAKVGVPDRPVVALCGDGGFLFSAQELAVAEQERIALTVVVFNDRCFGAVETAHRRQFGGRTLGTSLHNPDFVRFAESFGTTAYRADSPAALERALTQARSVSGPVLIEYALKETPPF